LTPKRCPIRHLPATVFRPNLPRRLPSKARARCALCAVWLCALLITINPNALP
jgi:hypothetical protein